MNILQLVGHCSNSQWQGIVGVKNIHGLDEYCSTNEKSIAGVKSIRRMEECCSDSDIT